MAKSDIVERLVKDICEATDGCMVELDGRLTAMLWWTPVVWLDYWSVWLTGAVAALASLPLCGPKLVHTASKYHEVALELTEMTASWLQMHS